MFMQIAIGAVGIDLYSTNYMLHYMECKHCANGRVFDNSAS